MEGSHASPVASGGEWADMGSTAPRPASGVRWYGHHCTSAFVNDFVTLFILHLDVHFSDFEN